MPRVSTIIPTYNGAAYLDRTLASACSQTYTDQEVIVLDDGSTDATPNILDRWSGRILALRQPNRGLSAARNAAARAATGEFLAYLDADDMWYPHKLAEQVAYLDAHPECGIVHTNLTIIDERDAVLHADWYSESGYEPASGYCLSTMLRGNPIQVPSVVERRSVFDRIGGFDERLRRCEDYPHWLRVLLEGYAIGYVATPLAYYRRHARSLSRAQVDMVEGLLQVFSILIGEHRLLERIGPDDVRAVRARIAAMERRLPKCYRWAGRNREAREKAAQLIASSPFEIEPYIDFLKSCVPTGLRARAREALA
jgi:glycosyltransferase involved in cell wall biosynthesis